MWNGEMKLRPETAEEIEDCTTPDGMRRRLFKYGFSNPLVRNVVDSSRMRGLSGEDTMTWLAFEALKRAERLQEITLETVNSNVRAPLIIKDSNGR